VPVHDERALFERLILEGFQAGLAWITILRKRENCRNAFDNFDPATIAAYDEAKIQTLLADPGIVRNQLKVRGAVRNAQAWQRMKSEGIDPVDFLWSFTGGATLQPAKPLAGKDVPAFTPEAAAMSKALQKRNFTFVGPTICYAFMQSVGMVNDHVVGCHLYSGPLP
jgi:DNA-3-methyladenine glycosylase I